MIAILSAARVRPEAEFDAMAALGLMVSVLPPAPRVMASAPVPAFTSVAAAVFAIVTSPAVSVRVSAPFDVEAPFMVSTVVTVKPEDIAFDTLARPPEVLSASDETAAAKGVPAVPMVLLPPATMARADAAKGPEEVIFAPAVAPDWTT